MPSTSIPPPSNNNGRPRPSRIPSSTAIPAPEPVLTAQVVFHQQANTSASATTTNTYGGNSGAFSAATRSIERNAYQGGSIIGGDSTTGGATVSSMSSTPTTNHRAMHDTSNNNSNNHPHRHPSNRIPAFANNSNNNISDNSTAATSTTDLETERAIAASLQHHAAEAALMDATTTIEDGNDDGNFGDNNHNNSNNNNNNNNTSSNITFVNYDATVAAFLPTAVDATGVEVIPSERDEERRQEKKRRLVLWVGGSICVGIALIIIVPLTTLTGGDTDIISWSVGDTTTTNNNNNSNNNNAGAPTMTPTMAPTTEHQATMLDYLEHQGSLEWDDEEWWTNATSAPYQATVWLSSEEHYLHYGGFDDDNGNGNNNNTQLIQRFALATFYFATSMAPIHHDNNFDGARDSDQWSTCDPYTPRDGEGCIDGVDWLSMEHECDWGFVACAAEESSDDDDNNDNDNDSDNSTGNGIPVEQSNHHRAVTTILFGLQGNNLHGTLPAQLSLLSELEVFIIPNNRVRGGMRTTKDTDEPIVLQAIDWAFQEVSTLQALNVVKNDFSGSLPTSLWQTNPNLKFIGLSDNRFDGTFRSPFNSNDANAFSSLPQLRELQLQGNHLTGTIPAWIGSFHASLEVLLLDANDLSGSIPPELYDLTQLKKLTVNNNTQLSGTIIDSERIPQLSNLELLAAGHTQLGGTLHESAMNSLVNMKELTIEHTNLGGTIHEAIGQWNNTLEMLWLHSNQMTGTLPSALDKLTHLEELRLENNQFVGTISQTVCAEKGTRFRDLVYITVDCEIACTCCDNDCPFNATTPSDRNNTTEKVIPKNRHGSDGHGSD